MRSCSKSRRSASWRSTRRRWRYCSRSAQEIGSPLRTPSYRIRLRWQIYQESATRFNMDIEAVVDLEPDLVYVFFPTFAEDLDRAGMKVLYIPTLSQDFRKVADNVRLWGQIVGSPNEAERVARDFEDRVEAIEDVMDPFGPGLSVFQDVGGFWTPGRGTLVQEVFDLLKLENIAFDIEGYAQISPEVIVDKDPDVIITGSVEGIEGEPALSNVRAVRNGAIYVPPTDALSIAGPRFVEGIEDLARWVYPGLFR